MRKILKECEHLLGYLSFGRCGKVVFQNGEHLEPFLPAFIVVKQEFLESVTLENGKDSIGDSHGRFDAVVFAREVDMFQLAYLAGGVLGLAQVMLHDELELGPIFLGFKLGERGHFTRERIVLEGLHQLCLPCGIDFTGEFVLLAVKFLAPELEKHYFLHVIADR